MKSSKSIAMAIAILLAALWSLPFVRAVSLLGDTRAYVAETGSINAANDLTFSSMLLASYIVSLAGAFAVAWMYSRSGSWLFIFPVAILGYSVIEVLRVQPEEVVVLFPAMAPTRPAILSVIAVALAVALFCVHRRFGRIRNVEFTAQPNGCAATALGKSRAGGGPASTS